MSLWKKEWAVRFLYYSSDLTLFKPLETLVTSTIVRLRCRHGLLVGRIGVSTCNDAVTANISHQNFVVGEMHAMVNDTVRLGAH